MANSGPVIVGLGVVAGHQEGRSRRMLAAEAARRAIEDAGLDPGDIDGSIDSRGGAGGGDDANYTDAFPRVLGLPINVHLSISRGSATGAGIVAAAGFLDRGVCRYVCIAGSYDDWSRSRRSRAEGRRGTLHPMEKEGYWGKAIGDLRAVSHHSWLAAKHMADYGTTADQLGAIAVAERQWACMNPEAQMFGRPITIDDYFESPAVVDPYRLLDISQVSDGAVAFVLTSADRAKDAKSIPVEVLGVGFGETAGRLWWEQENYTRLPVATAKEQAFGQAGITLADVDVAELYDCFTGEVLFQLEDYGWCEKGDGGPFAASGATAPGGGIPVNTGGGLLSSYHLGVFTGFAEAVRQVRGECGERQVPNCEIAIASSHGHELLAPGMCSLHNTLVLARGN